MLETLIWLTAGMCAASALLAWSKYRDVFHPIVLITPMFGFMYVYMPLRLLEDEQLYSFVTEDQAVFYQGLIVATLGAFFVGCFWGSSQEGSRQLLDETPDYDPTVIKTGALCLGFAGIAAWFYTIANAGGFIEVFSSPKGGGWSNIGYIRDSIYLTIIGILLLLSPQGFRARDRKWLVCLAAFAVPFLIQGLLGARRGPTLLVLGSLGLSWYLARRKRPSFVVLVSSGTLLAFLLLFLVLNRGNIYIGSKFELDSDVSKVVQSTAANEYVFGAGCVFASEQNHQFFWGKRYWAQIFVRPIPSALWPTKYYDVGLPEIMQNAGVAGGGLREIMGWEEVPGAAAGVVADLWVEFSWASIAVMLIIGWSYGFVWQRAIWLQGPWTTIFTVCMLLSVYLVSQGGEAVIFRFVILTVPAYLVWARARRDRLVTHVRPTGVAKIRKSQSVT